MSTNCVLYIVILDSFPSKLNDYSLFQKNKKNKKKSNTVSFVLKTLK